MSLIVLSAEGIVVESNLPEFLIFNINFNFCTYLTELTTVPLTDLLAKGIVKLWNQFCQRVLQEFILVLAFAHI